MRPLSFLLFIAIAAVPIANVYAQPAELNFDGLDTPAHSVPLPQAVQPETTPQPATEPTRHRVTLWYLIQSSGFIGYTIILLSLIAAALIIEYAISIRRPMLIPTNFAEDVLKLLIQGLPNQALKKCQDDPSALAQILYAGMVQYEFGWDAVERSAEEATAEQASRLYRKVEYLNMLGNIAPMLGLLGTVVGMVFAFQEMAASEGYGRAADLAEGIYLALITTIQGLLVAIPCLAAHSLFSNKIAALVSETTHVAEQVLQPIKKNLLRSRTVKNQ